MTWSEPVIGYQLSVFLHILSAIVWIGGMFFLALVVVPATRGVPRPSAPRCSGTLAGASGRSDGPVSGC